MKNEQWEAIHTIFEEMEQLCGDLKSPLNGKVSSLSTGTEDAGVPQKTGPEEKQNEDIVRVRARIRTKLNFLQAKLAETLLERDCYLTIFPIVAYFDEYIQANYLNSSHRFWPSLQKELFQIDEGGELFYETLDDILRKPQTLPLIYEVFYFCLNHGFRGKYNDNPVKINEYLKKLREKIPIHKQENIEAAPDETGQIKFVSSTAGYYVLVFIILGASYFLLQAAADYWGLKFIF